jgi:L-Ala-D/L-Glu epimerase
MALSTRTYPYALRLKTPLLTALGPIAGREGWLLRVEDEAGHFGWGEASPLPGFVEPAAAAAHAYDQAVLDLGARRAGVPLWRLLADDAPTRVPVNQLEGEGGPGVRCIKLKVGGDVRADLRRVEALRRRAGGAVALRVDANGAWTLAQALEALPALEALGVELLEQPVAAGAIRELASLRGRTRVAIAADEAVGDLAQARRLIEASAADVFVLKPMRLGGLVPAAAIAAEARAAGVEVVVTTVLEGAIGRAGAVHLAAAVGSRRLAHGLATGSLLAEDVGVGLEPEDGWIEVPQVPGLGVVPS